jgi:type IV secretory pathway VirB9-like protein
MRYWVFVLLLLTSCAAKDEPLPWVPPAPEDLSTWSAPSLVPLPPVPDTPPPPAPVRAAAPNEILYDYQVSREYEVPVPLGWPADVVLEPGEIVHTIVGGDRAPVAEGEPPRWEVKEGQSETQYTPVQHVFFVATYVGQQMGVIVATSRRTYYLTLKCVKKTDVRAIRWRYPPPPVPPVVVAKAPRILPDPLQPHRLHVGYLVLPPDPAPEWTPRQVVDDGQKMYILLPNPTRFAVAPLVRGIGPNGPFIVSARQMDTVIILDQLIGHLELRYGEGETAEVVKVSRGPLTTIVCPGGEQCPWWPEEWPKQAQRRTP